MDTALIKALQLILSLSILVVLHEGGHFFFSKLFKVKVEKFYLFFDPYFHLFSTKDKWITRIFPKLKKNETEYGVGWLPFGGYVKIAGMIDESMDTEQMKQPVQPWEFRAKPAWQRLFIMIGGVLVNFLLALFIYSMVLFAWGEEYLPMKQLTQGFQFNEQAEKLGFRDGDRLLAADGVPFERWDANVYRTLTESQVITVERDGRTLDIQLTEELDLLKMLKEQPPFMAPVVPSVIDSVLPGLPAAEAGIKKGDRILAVDGTAVTTWSDFDYLMAKKSDVLAAGCSPADSARLRQMQVVFQAEGSAVVDTVTLQLSKDYMLGIVKKSLFDYCTLAHNEYGFWESFPAGISHGMTVLSGYVSDLKYMFTSEGVKNVGSFGTIGSIFPATWDWQSFWEITAFLSLMLAVMNILPIPALDGGHVLFLIAEMIMRRPPSQKFMERAQMVGLALLMGLMLLACYNDIVKFLL